MAEFPYSANSSKLPAFLEKIQSASVPDKVTLKYIASLGFKSSSDRRISAILKDLEFTDFSGVPTERWGIYRDRGRAPGELAVAIRKTYANLFAVYPNA